MAADFAAVISPSGEREELVGGKQSKSGLMLLLKIGGCGGETTQTQ